MHIATVKTEQKILLVSIQIDAVSRLGKNGANPGLAYTGFEQPMASPRLS